MDINYTHFKYVKIEAEIRLLKYFYPTDFRSGQFAAS